MDIKQLEAFCMVVRQGSFSKAARVLGVSQPTVSAHISTLEKELGCELLIRTSKSILPTDKGATLLGYAQGIMSLRQKALEELSREDSRYTGSITIAASSVPAQYCLPELLSEFSREYPGGILTAAQHQQPAGCGGGKARQGGYSPYGRQSGEHQLRVYQLPQGRACDNNRQ